jgi:hypothetical protein
MDRKPVETVVTDTKPVETGVTDTKPVETTVTDTKPVETTVTETKPIEATVTDTKPVETGVTETMPVERVVTDTKPIEATVTDAKPVETGVTKTNAVETTVTDTKPVETGVTKTNAVETIVTDTKPVETGVTETKLDKTTVIDTKPEDKTINRLVESTIVDAGKMGIVAVPMVPENIVEPVCEQGTEVGSGALESLLAEAGKTIAGVVHIDSENISEPCIDRNEQNSNEKDGSGIIKNVVMEAEKIITGVAHVDTSTVENSSEKSVDKDQSTIDMSKSDIATTVSEDMGQPNTCSTPKSEKENPFETEVENESEPVVGKGDTMKKNEGVINDTWTVDITDIQNEQEVPSENVVKVTVDDVAYVPDIVVTSPKCPPNEDCVVVLQEEPSEAATISGTNSVSIDVEPGNEESNDIDQNLKSLTDTDQDTEKNDVNLKSESNKAEDEVMQENMVEANVNGKRVAETEKKDSRSSENARENVVGEATLLSEEEEIDAILDEIDQNLNSGEKKVLTKKLKENIDDIDMSKPLTKTNMKYIIENGIEFEIDKQILKEIKSEAYDVDVMSTISEVTTESNTQSLPKGS